MYIPGWPIRAQPMGSHRGLQESRSQQGPKHAHKGPGGPQEPRSGHRGPGGATRARGAQDGPGGTQGPMKAHKSPGLARKSCPDGVWVVTIQLPQHKK